MTCAHCEDLTFHAIEMLYIIEYANKMIEYNYKTPMCMFIILYRYVKQFTRK